MLNLSVEKGSYFGVGVGDVGYIGQGCNVIGFSIG